ncbi:CopG family transcriptional regulator [candidate division BRC1 bacterium SM23_51]|nr:MAG: CopG family transcriptional regulator [candidate division BRC1 bacterium SM23_51]
MSGSNKRSTFYLDPALHRALRLKSVETSRSMSDLVNEAVKELLAEDAEDLAAFEERAGEPLLTFEAMLKDLKKRGRI